MTDGDTVAQVAVVILLLALAVPALATAYDYAGTPLEYEEQVTVDYGNETQVSQSATLEGYGTDPTIEGESATLNESEDYEWNASSGTITWLDGPNSINGDSATITYRAHQRTAESELAWTLISPFMALFGLFGLVVSVRALWEFTAEVWGL